MTPGDAARVLAVAAMFDRRTVGETDAIAWADALAGYDPRECAEAVRAHYAKSIEWLMPAHIHHQIRAARRLAAQAERDHATLRSIKAATGEHDKDRAHAAYLDARAAFDEALRKKREAAGETNSDVRSTA